MAEKTGVSWAHHTSNIAIGCMKVGPGCDGCYAEALDRARFSKTLGGGTKEIPITHWGPGAPRYFRLEAWRKDIEKWNRDAYRDGVRRRVFIDSLSDFFDNEWPWQVRDSAWAVMRQCTALDFLIVTKRIGNAAAMLPPEWKAFGPFRNVWIIATIVNMKEALRDIPTLMRVPAAVHGISYEPALEALDWDLLFDRGAYGPGNEREFSLPHWVIVGGESNQIGHRARPFDLAWARSAVAACKAARVACYVKQLGSAPYWGPKSPLPDGVMVDPRGLADDPIGIRLVTKNRGGADPSEWPEDLRVQEFPR